MVKSEMDVCTPRKRFLRVIRPVMNGFMRNNIPIMIKIIPVGSLSIPVVYTKYFMFAMSKESTLRMRDLFLRAA